MRAPLLTRLAPLGLALAGLVGCAEPAAFPYPAYSPPAYGAPPSPVPGAPAAAAWDPGQAVIAFAAAQIGRPYCWGGTGPRCFDCSGLTMVAWQQVGVRLPRTADAVAQTLPEVPLTQVRPGDVLWWPGHVALYAGNGWTIEALDSRSGVISRRAPRPRRAFRPVLPRVGANEVGRTRG